MAPDLNDLPPKSSETVEHAEIPIAVDNLDSDHENDEDSPEQQSEGYSLLNAALVESNLSGDETESDTVNDSEYIIPNYVPPSIMAQFDEALNHTDHVHLPDAEGHIPTTESFNLNEDHISTIQECMSKFALPKESHPDWARNVNEHDWMQLLLTKIRDTNN